MVMEHLFTLGHQRIGYISGPQDNQIQSSRINGYMESLENMGLDLNTGWIIQGDWSMESGKIAMNQLFDQGNIPTAIFAANDAMAIGVIMEALDLGLSVLEDISVVGFDNIDQSIYFRLSFTTVAIDYDSMSRAACMLMFDMIDHENSELNVNIYVPLSLIDRESTRRLKLSNMASSK